MKSNTMAFALALALGLPLLLSAGTAEAVLHLMQIEKVIAGVDGDPTAQAVQLRMRSSFQNLLQFGRLIAWDASGANPIVILDYPTDVTNHGAGVRILAVTPSLAALTQPATTTDYVLTNPIPPSYLAAGSLTFEDDSGLTIYWRLSWGGVAYTGSNFGGFDNDLDGDFGPPIDEELTTVGATAVQFLGIETDPSTNNLADFALTAGDVVTLTNNAGDSFELRSTSVSSPASLESVMRLYANAPNPFNPRTLLRYSLTTPAHVRLMVYDTRGRIVSELVDAFEGEGEHAVVWDARDGGGGELGSGVYLAKLQVGDVVDTQKMVLSR